jgi:hypothetical protein
MTLQAMLAHIIDPDAFLTEAEWASLPSPITHPVRL